jgi:hypothetical protein
MGFWLDWSDEFDSTFLMEVGLSAALGGRLLSVVGDVEM